MHELIQISQKCCSLALVGITYWYTKIINYEVLSEELEVENKEKDDSTNRYITEDLLNKFT